MRRATLAAALACLLLAGCGGDRDEDAQQTAPPRPERQAQGGDGEARPPVGDGSGRRQARPSVGDFTAPVYVTEPPGADGTTDLYVVEQAGRIRVDPRRRGPATSRSSTSAATSSRAASRGCCRSPSHPTTRSPASSTSTTPTPTATPGWSSTGARPDDPYRADPGSARELLFVDQPFANHNGGLAPLRPRRPPLHRPRRRRLGRRPGPQRPEPRHPARQDPADRPRARAAAGRYRIPADNPFVGQRRARAGDLRLRAAQPVALLLRPRDPARSRSATSARTSCEEIDYARRAAPGANFGWSAFEGRARFNEDESAPGHVAPDPHLRPRRGLLGDRRLRRPRPGACLALRPLPLRRLLRWASCAASGRRRRGRRARAGPPGRPLRAGALLLRRGRRRAPLRHVARRARLPSRSAMRKRLVIIALRPRGPRRRRAPGDSPAGGRRRRSRAEADRQLRPAGLRHRRAGIPAAALRRRAARAGSRSSTGGASCGARSSTSRASSATATSRACSRSPSPRLQAHRRFYVSYTDNQGDLNVDEFRRRSADRAARGSRRTVIEIRHRLGDNHNGGQLQFLGRPPLHLGRRRRLGRRPADNAKNRDALLGKILRIDPRNPRGPRAYRVPRSNPFVGRPGRDEIFSYGLRNPFRFSFDRIGGGVPDRDRRRRPGQLRGDRLRDAARRPRRQLRLGRIGGLPRPTSATAACATAAPTKPDLRLRTRAQRLRRDRRLRGPRPAPARPLRGRYVYADFCEGQLRSFAPRLGRRPRRSPIGVSRPRLDLLRRGRTAASTSPR